MGPAKVIVKGDALHDAQTGKLIKDGLSTQKTREDYAAHHYIALPVVDNTGKPWMLNGNPDRKSTRLNSSHPRLSRMPSSA